MTDTHLSDVRFDQLEIHPEVQQGVESAGFEFCTPIQAESLPIALQGKDISGQAQTGTGKTAAFLIACFHRLLNQEAKQSKKQNPIRALVLAPTRELAIQIHADGIPLAKHTKLKLGIAYGGTNYEKQRTDIEAGIDVLIGTPGRIIDYFKQGVFALDALEVIILDEADRMFDLGFIADIRYLFRRMPSPEQRLNMLFSATLSLRVAELAYEHMSEPEVIKIEAETITADRIMEIGYMPSNEEKIPLLLGLLKQAGDQKVLVFINTKHMAEKLEAWMGTNGFNVALLSGDVPQNKRERLLDKFKRGECNVLVATDVAARGLHIPDVSYVINFDLPDDAEDYVHRVGRTARAGASGTAISLICETYAMNIVDIEQFIEHAIPVVRDIADLLFKDAAKPDLSKLRSNRKPIKSKGGRGTRTRAPQNRSRNDEAPRKQNDSAKAAKVDQRSNFKTKQQSGDSKNNASKNSTFENKAVENKITDVDKSVQDNAEFEARVIPLRVRQNKEIPAIG